MSDNPQNPGQFEWYNCAFRMLDDNELFYLENQPYRKMSDNTALNVKEQKIIQISPNARVYQKEY